MGVSRGSRPMRSWLGVMPIVAFLELLCTAVAIVSHLLHSSWFVAMSLRYCSTHWFFLSESPSVWGWYAVDRFCWMPRLLVSALPKCDVNLGSLSLMMRVGSPNHL